MMNKFIEIQEGICVNIDEIEAIEEADEFSCKVYVGTRTYLSTFPYETLMKLLKKDDVVDKAMPQTEQTARTMKKLDAVLGNVGYFAG